MKADSVVPLLLEACFGVLNCSGSLRRTPAYTDRLNMHYIVCICLQIPQCTAPCGSVHFLDKAQHANIFSLLWMDKTIFNRKPSLHFSLKPDDFK